MVSIMPDAVDPLLWSATSSPLSTFVQQATMQWGRSPAKVTEGDRISAYHGEVCHLWRRQLLSRQAP